MQASLSCFRQQVGWGEIKLVMISVTLTIEIACVGGYTVSIIGIATFIVLTIYQNYQV